MGASPHGDVLQCLPWGQVKRPDWQPLPLALTENGQIVASALVLKRNLPRVKRSIFYLPRGPILDWSRPTLFAALLHQLRGLARRHRAILLKIDPAVALTSSDAPQVLALLNQHNFVASPDANNAFGGTQPRFNMKLDISGSDDEVMARFHQKWRYNVRLAARKGVEVETVTQRASIAIFHELYRITAERDGFTGRPLSYFEKLWDALVPAGLAQFFIARREGNALSAAICFALGEQCWYVYGASSNEDRKMMPNHAMQWAMMQWARERGCKLYDFRGVHDVPKPENAGANFDVSTLDTSQLMESEDGLVRFKAGFGAQLSEYVGEWDLPLQRNWYWLWTSARPQLVRALKKARR